MSVIAAWLGRSIGRPRDAEERAPTRYVLQSGGIGLLWALIVPFDGRPEMFGASLLIAFRPGARSQGGDRTHLASVVETCMLVGWYRRATLDYVHAHFDTEPAAVAMLLLRSPSDSTLIFMVHGPAELDAPVSLALGEKNDHARFAVAGDSSIAGIPVLVVPQETGWLVPAGDVDALVEAPRAVLEPAPPVLSHLGQCGRERAAELHDIDQDAEVLAGLFPPAIVVDGSRGPN